jgi:hypothetical protein
MLREKIRTFERGEIKLETAAIQVLSKYPQGYLAEI